MFHKEPQHILFYLILPTEEFPESKSSKTLHTIPKGNPTSEARCCCYFIAATKGCLVEEGKNRFPLGVEGAPVEDKLFDVFEIL